MKPTNSKVYLLHAYSSKNSGDGLLVKLSLKQIRNLGVTEKINIVCLDPESFKGYINTPGVRILSLFQYISESIVDIITRKNSISFGVGGGYLRSSDAKEGLKSLIAHGTQIFLANLKNGKSYYLPQSVGPLKGIPGKLISHLTKKIDLIFSRDDKTITELSSHRNIIRCPDLVAIEILENINTIKPRHPNCTGLIFRDLPSYKKSKTYEKSLKEILNRTISPILLLQSHSRGNNDDKYYKRTLPDYTAIPVVKLAEDFSPSVISVRLHGSLESILRGSPSIHLSYERKGFSAYKDLGLEEYVFDSKSFSALEVIKLNNSIHDNSEFFWQKIKYKATSFESPLRVIKVN
ncbi:MULTISPECIES: polysaccharide pyruvyl transferase family protein [unclassified Pseudomonas]|uniref:polysaccharide pyruvyl transferase family protein n=1 Tax=unclassified Pseudomonas TaxID=196821 RepID=UPI0009F671F1|nr:MULTISPECIES: polysaccharide pyruvyl transferase family protein [unclassified Pseudomonas]QOF86327.1 polysaccharide pyruvyl transferase family protein [Pseudomonas sp. ADPe]